MSTTAIITAAPTNVAAIAETIDAQLSPASRAAYDSALAAFAAYCGQHGWPVWPASQDEAGAFIVRVLSWLQSKADEGCATSTIVKLVSGVKSHAARESFIASAALAVSPDLRGFTKGLANQRKAVIVRKAAALTVDDLAALHKALRPRTARNLRNRALIALGVAAALRAQSIADLRLGDVERSLTVDGFNVHVRWSKTDQVGEGRTITVLRAAKRDIDPVTAIKAWLDFLSGLGFTPATTPNVPLFPHVRGASVQADRSIGSADASDAITDLVRRAVVVAGIADEAGAQAYSSHSLRSTFITLSAQYGASEAQVAAVSGHKNLNVLRGYDRTSGERMAQVTYLGE